MLGLIVGGLHTKADAQPADALTNDVVKADERTATYKENVGGVHLNVLLLGMLAPALWRDVGDGALKHLQQRLLHALAGDVAGDRDVV